ncbi:type VI secretion system Vgr family protein [Kalamiella sp. sgz302252]|uniref:type VI secretion system Vgr family protein n=1 Tax=Pantoea sp. sgz302252 TaxID=3341827 RepID=UPI0036D34A4C
MLNRITVHAPDKTLLFWKLSGHEALSEPFGFKITLLSPAARIDSASLLGQPLTLSVPLQTPNPVRYLNGKITRVAQGAVELGGTRYTTCELTLESNLWPMKRDRNLRIFQEKTVPQIVKTLLKEYQVSVEDRLIGSYRIWEYCVQYQESSLNFISRLMELEGIGYFFRHEENDHTLVLTDSPDRHQAFSGYETIPYHQTQSGGVADEEGIGLWETEMVVTPGLYSLDDYDFRKPHAWLLKARQNPASPQPGDIDVFDWPGHYIDHGHGEFYARMRQERWQVEHRQIHGLATALGLCPGYTFTLFNAPDKNDNGKYLVASVEYKFEENRYASGNESAPVQALKFTVLPADIPWRPEPRTQWPRTFGPQTAKVVGPAGEAIWTDSYGRVKVKFHWDREAKGDATSSCWIRVSSAWAGQGYGGVQIPRVGDEVIVDFINGDPDRPIITGRVYNQASMPPWSLPAAATQMGFMSRSKGGTVDNANMLRFEDKAGSEQVFIQAERNMDTSVKNEESHTVGSNRTKSVKGNETTTVEKNRTETVNGDEAIAIAGSRTESVGGSETVTVSGERLKTVEQNETVTVGGERKITVTGSEKLTVQNNKSKTVKGMETSKISKSRKHQVGANDSLLVNGNKRDSIKGSRKALIRADDKLTVAGLRTKTIRGGEISAVNGMQIEKVNGIQTLTVNQLQTINLLAGREVGIVGNDLRQANGNITDCATGEINIVVGEDSGISIKNGEITLSAGGAIIVINSEGVAVNGQEIKLNA